MGYYSTGEIQSQASKENYRIKKIYKTNMNNQKRWFPSQLLERDNLGKVRKFCEKNSFKGTPDNF